ncbi:MAG: PH domain-containing protein [Actinomycetota bacterium]|nr:PH domain-containing protein [Actinomycetota bacterium]
MTSLYRDRWIECTGEGVTITGYYFPWGAKHVPYDRIRSVERVALGTFTGRARIWGTANPRYWANLDPRRPGKKIGLILDNGARVRPFITPDDPDAAEAVIREHSRLGSAGRTARRGPLI